MMIAATQTMTTMNPATMPIGRVLQAYWFEARSETLATLRTPALALPFLAVPMAIYFLFGIVMAGSMGVEEAGPNFSSYMFCGFATLAAAMPGIFGPSTTIPLDREGGVLKLKRALPMPPGSNLVAKIASSMLVATIALTGVVGLAFFAGTTPLSLGQFAIIWCVLLLGSIPFCAIGFFIGSFASSSAAPAYSNLLFLPMMWLSGLFIPLPEFLQRWVVIWPAFHLDQLAIALAGIEEFTFVPPSITAGVLVGITVLLGGFAIRRIARSG